MATPPRFEYGSTNPRSPLASETETDDPGIMFAPKRYHERLRSDGTAGAGERAGRNTAQAAAPGISNEASSGSDTTLTEGEQKTESPAKNDGAAATVVLGEVAVVEATPDAQKPTGQRQTGQTISETELMRRRRLLDSHIFD